MTALLAALDFIPRWILMALLVASLAAGCVEKVKLESSKKSLAELTAAVEKQKVDAKALLASETAKTEAVNAKLNDAKDKQESEDAINNQTITVLADKLHATRLRDPGGGGCGGSTQSGVAASPTTGTTDTAKDTGFLSAELTNFLIGQAKAADEVNLAYISCRADSYKLRSTLNP